MELPVKVQIRIKSREGPDDDSVIPVSSTKVTKPVSLFYYISFR